MKKSSETIKEGLLASILSLLSFGKQVKLLRKLYTASKDPELEELIHDMQFNEKRYKDEIKRLKKKYPELK